MLGLFNLQNIRFGRDPINVYEYLMLGNKKKELISSHRYPIKITRVNESRLIYRKFCLDVEKKNLNQSS